MPLKNLQTNIQLDLDDPVYGFTKSAEYLGLTSQRTLSTWLSCGRYPELVPVKLGKRAIGFRRSILNAFIAQHMAISA